MEPTTASGTPVPFNQVLDEALQDPQVRAEWERIQLADDVANWILRYRIDSDLTQAELAELLGWKQSVVARLESAEREPSLATLRHLVTRLGSSATIAIRPQGVEVHFTKPRASIANEIHQRRRAQRRAALETTSRRARRGPVARKGVGQRGKSAAATV